MDEDHPLAFTNIRFRGLGDLIRTSGASLFGEVRQFDADLSTAWRDVFDPPIDYSDCEIRIRRADPDSLGPHWHYFTGPDQPPRWNRVMRRWEAKHAWPPAWLW